MARVRWSTEHTAQPRAPCGNLLQHYLKGLCCRTGEGRGLKRPRGWNPLLHAGCPMFYAPPICPEPRNTS